MDTGPCLIRAVQMDVRLVGSGDPVVRAHVDVEAEQGPVEADGIVQDDFHFSRSQEKITIAKINIENDTRKIPITFFLLVLNVAG